MIYQMIYQTYQMFYRVYQMQLSNFGSNGMPCPRATTDVSLPSISC